MENIKPVEQNSENDDTDADVELEENSGLCLNDFCPPPGEQSETNDKGLPKTKADLLEVAGQVLSNDEMQDLQENMARFERHLRIKQPPLANVDDQIEKTYQEIGKLFKTAADLNENGQKENETGLTADQLKNLGLQSLNHATRPSDISQGGHLTCNATTIEEVAYTIAPGNAVEVVASIALNGYYQDPDGQKITVDNDSIKPDHEAARIPPLDGDRDHASQLFQVYAVNDHWQRQTPPMFYQQRPSDGKSTGERLVDAEGNLVPMPQGLIEPVNQPLLYDDALVGIGERLTGRSDLILMHTDRDSVMQNMMDTYPRNLHVQLSYLNALNRIPGPIAIHSNRPELGQAGADRLHVVHALAYDENTGELAIQDPKNADNVLKIKLDELNDSEIEHLSNRASKFDSPEQLQAMLEARQREGRLPSILAVRPSMGVIAGNPGHNWHYVSVVNYFGPETANSPAVHEMLSYMVTDEYVGSPDSVDYPIVGVSNQWGDSNQYVSSNSLYGETDSVIAPDPGDYSNDEQSSSDNSEPKLPEIEITPLYLDKTK